MPYLEVNTPQGRKRFNIAEQPVTIGRYPDNTVVLHDDRASRHHCVIEPSKNGAGFHLRDLGSRNGTRLNNGRVSTHPLKNGDIVRIGDAELRFIDPEEEQREAEAKRQNVPDFAASTQEVLASQDYLQQPTLDIDLNEEVSDVKTSYEKQLYDIIESAVEKPFDEDDISLVDLRGVTIHQATSSGGEQGSGNAPGESIRTFRLLLLAAFRSRATDIHIEPRVENATCRLRVDGYMISAAELGINLFKRILGVVKILCQIDTSQKSTVQDGHFSVNVKGRRVDYRVSLTPAMHGQKLVIRVLDTSNSPDRLHELGLVPWMYEKLRNIATKDSGLLLACGPTGSGKTTTLYSCLREINVEQRNAITIEDPVEYYLEGCTQIPVDHKQGATFANILRSVLRQDPDVIFVGEVRDLETATVAMQAAMTGHLVYTTVHAKDTIGAVFRLLDLGIENYLVANALNMIIAQRLVRVLCESCKKPVKPTPTQLIKLGKSVGGTPYIYSPVGCRQCLRTGYRGRRAMFELLEVNDTIRDIILKSPSINAIREVAQQGMFMSLQRYGAHLALEGVTSMEEIERVATSE